MLYKQIILPIADYGDFILDGAPEGAVKFIQTIQNHFLRCSLGICKPLDMSRNNVHKNCECEWLDVRRRTSVLSKMYHVASDPNNIMVPVSVLRGNSKIKLKVRKPSGALYRKSPLYRGRDLWSKLDGSVQKSITKQVFKGLL